MKKTNEEIKSKRRIRNQKAMREKKQRKSKNLRRTNKTTIILNKDWEELPDVWVPTEQVIKKKKKEKMIDLDMDWEELPDVSIPVEKQITKKHREEEAPTKVSPNTEIQKNINKHQEEESDSTHEDEELPDITRSGEQCFFSFFLVNNLKTKIKTKQVMYSAGYANCFRE